MRQVSLTEHSAPPGQPSKTVLVAMVPDAVWEMAHNQILRCEHDPGDWRKLTLWGCPADSDPVANPEVEDIEFAVINSKDDSPYIAVERLVRRVHARIKKGDHASQY